MSEIAGGRGGEGNIIGDIKRACEAERQDEGIFRRWVKGNSPGQIAKEFGLPAEVAYQRLKRLQKEWIAEQGGGIYGKRREF